MDDYSLPDVSTRARLVIAVCALAFFVGCVVRSVMIWPTVVDGVARSAPFVEQIRKLADRPAQRGAWGARLTPECARLALIALRVYADLLDQPSLDLSNHPWRTAGLNSGGRSLEILAPVKNAVIARAAFEQAVIQRTNRKLHLRHRARVVEETG